MTRPLMAPYPPLTDTKTRKVTPELKLSDREREVIMDEVRAALHTHYVDEIALIIGKSESCLHAIRRGDTRWPRWDTLFPLMRALGLRLKVEKSWASRSRAPQPWQEKEKEQA